METVGFVYLDNVQGFNKEVEENLHKVASWFFSLPMDEKLRVPPKKWNPDAKGVYRGRVANVKNQPPNFEQLIPCA